MNHNSQTSVEHWLLISRRGPLFCVGYWTISYKYLRLQWCEYTTPYEEDEFRLSSNSEENTSELKDNKTTVFCVTWLNPHYLYPVNTGACYPVNTGACYPVKAGACSSIMRKQKIFRILWSIRFIISRKNKEMFSWYYMHGHTLACYPSQKN